MGVYFRVHGVVCDQRQSAKIAAWTGTEGRAQWNSLVRIRDSSVGQPKCPGDQSASLAQARKLIPPSDGVRGAASAGVVSVVLEGCERRR